MTNETNTRKKSKFQKKLARKRGKGKVDPKWMWWFER